MVKKPALGKGMASLIQANSSNSLMNALDHAEMPGGEEKKSIPTPPSRNIETGAVLIDISQIKENQFQPRKIFKEEDLLELSESIRENGIIQPVIVTKTDNGFELIAGERRLRAARKIGLEKIPAIIRRATDREKLVLAIIENVQRSDLNCVEEAFAYYQLMEDFKLTQEEVAKKVGKERSTVANFLRILKLPRPVIELLKKELLSFGHAKVLASVKNIERVKFLAEEVVKETLSVRELEKLANENGSGSPAKPQSSRFKFDEKIDQLKQNLEKKTGFHFSLAAKKNGSGQVIIKFQNENEFNNIYEFLLK